MTRKTTSRRAQRSPAIPRDVLFASLGAVSLGRKQMLKSYADAASAVHALRGQAGLVVRQASAQAAGLRDKAQSSIVPVRKKVLALVSTINSKAKAQLQPVLKKLGVAENAAPAKKARKKAVVTRAPAKRARKAA